MENVPSLPQGPSDRDGPAWEAQGRSFDHLIDTVREVLGGPARCFRSMRRTGGLREPVLFYLITGTVGALASSLFQLAFDRDPGSYGCLVFVLPLLLFVVPLVLAIGLFVTSGILHVMLILLDDARQPFETTARVVAYAAGSTTLLGVIPFVGGMIGVIWQIVAEIIGLSEAHEIPIGKSALAVLLPVIVCFALLAILVVAVGVATIVAIFAAVATRGGR